MPGVLGVFTGADLEAAGYGRIRCAVPLKNADGSEMRNPMRPALPTDRVRFVGDPVAIVVAETPVQARDAEIGRVTSELQSLMRNSYDVFCSEKKQKQNTTQAQ